MRVAVDARKIDDYGIGTYIRSLIDAACLLQPDWRFTLIGPSADPSLEGRANVDFSPCAGRGYGPADIVALSTAARTVVADVFHCPHYVTPIGLDIPLVVTIHDCIHLRFPEYMPRPLGVLPRAVSTRYARMLLQRVPRVAERIIAVTASTRGDIIDLLGAGEAPIDVIHNGVSRFWSQPADSSAATASRPILWVGNPKPHKGLDLLLGAFAMLASRDPNLRLILVGSGAIASQVADHPYRDRVEVPGHVTNEQLRSLYRGAGVFCMPSRHEGFGLPALEAMAAGVPVVAAAAGAIPEVVGDAALLVPAEDTGALAAGLDRVLHGASAAAELVAAGHARARRFTWERCAEQTCSSYLAAVGGSP